MATQIVVRRNPTRAVSLMEPIYRPVSWLDEVEHMVNDVWETWTPVVYSRGTYPPIDMFERKNELVVRMELPGIRKEDIGVSLEGDNLIITAEKKPEEESKDFTFYACERCFGDYSRSVSLPFPVEADKTTATFENGLLEIRLPKAEEARSKHIDVKVI